MPNWVKGDLKVRGKIEDIKRFVKEGLMVVDFYGNEMDIIEFNYDTEESFYINITETLWMKDSRRHFIEPSYGIEAYASSKEENAIMIAPMKAAWAIDTIYLQDISNKYNVDLKIFAFESGAEFCQDIEVHKGEIILDETITYDDYQWECVCPTIGG